MHTRSKKELSLRFRFRSTQASDQCPRPLLITLRMDGHRISDYNSGVMLRPTRWNQFNQIATGRNKFADEINERLAQIELTHREILRELKRRHAKGEGQRPTPEMVKAEFFRPGSTSPTIIDCYKSYLHFLDSLDGTEDGRAEKTITRAYKTLDHLRGFVSPALTAPRARFEKPCTMAELKEIDQKAPYLTDITTGWGKRFHSWLQTPITGKRTMSKDSANKYLSHVRDAINYAVDEGFLSNNPLDKFRPKRGKGKEVYFLEPEHLERLLGINLPDQAGVVLWWTRLMCLTGLDYVDAVRYARDRQTFHRRNATGLKIVIERSKPPKNTCEIPLIGQINDLVDALFMDYPFGPAAPVLADINRNLKLIQVAIGFGKPLTSKICRKTAGAFLLREGYRIETVSKALGHSSIRTTEAHYVKVTTSVTDYDMERVARQQAEGGIRLQPIVIELPFQTSHLPSFQVS